MSSNSKEVKIRLESIKNTRKITKAMELVSVAKMRHAVEIATETRSWHNMAWHIVENLLSSRLWFDANNPIKKFFEPVKTKGITTLVIFTSNRGLCGAFNSNVTKQALSWIEKRKKKDIRIITIGNKGGGTLSSLGYDVELSFKKDDSAKDDTSVMMVANSLYDSFAKGETNKVLVIYTNYKSPVEQNAVIKQLFPFKFPPEVGTLDEESETEIDHNKKLGLEYLYEPDKYEVLEYLTPRIAQAELYQALLESNASEHSARMVAMKNASDSAEEMAQDLTMQYNKARQSAITQEIAEISAGMSAVS
jgi:F-type H+-transporting ATPase subunit gamma